MDEDSRVCFIRTIKISPAQEKDLRQQWVTDFRKTKWCQIQSGGRKSVFHLKTSKAQCSLYIESRFHAALELLLWNSSVGRVKHYFTNTNPFLKPFNTLKRRPKYVATSTRLKIDAPRKMTEFFINNTFQNEGQYQGHGNRGCWGCCSTPCFFLWATVNCCE